MIRGTSTDNPVLLFLAGGPGGTELGAMRRHGQALEKDFVVVTWDQRGAGKSYDSLDPISTLTLQQAVSDTVEVSNYLRNRFGQDKIYLLGQSYGTILGVLAAQQHPELYRAYIGVGQMVDPRETDGVFYTDALAWARRSGNTALVNKLTSSGPPPYTDMLDYEPALTNDAQVYPYDHTRNSEGAGGFSENLSVEEYTLLEQATRLRWGLRCLHRPVPTAAGHRLPQGRRPARRPGLPDGGTLRSPRAAGPSPAVVRPARRPDQAAGSPSTPPATDRCSSNPTCSTRR